MLIGANSRTVAAAVEAKVGEINGDARHAGSLPPDVRAKPVYNRTELVNATVATVERNLAEGAILVVDVPVLALTGTEGKMFKPMALTVILALAAAFVLSLTLIPALVAWLIRGRVRERENAIVRAAR